MTYCYNNHLRLQKNSFYGYKIYGYKKIHFMATKFTATKKFILWLTSVYGYKKIRDTFALERLLQNDSKRFCLLTM